MSVTDWRSTKRRQRAVHLLRVFLSLLVVTVAACAVYEKDPHGKPIWESTLSIPTKSVGRFRDVASDFSKKNGFSVGYREAQDSSGLSRVIELNTRNYSIIASNPFSKTDYLVFAYVKSDRADTQNLKKVMSAMLNRIKREVPGAAVSDIKKSGDRNPGTQYPIS